MSTPQQSKDDPPAARQERSALSGTGRMPWRIDGSAVLLGLQTWNRRQTFVAAGVAMLAGVLIGLATVLIPNPVFTRDIPPVWWNVPVLVVVGVLTGMLAATYVRSEPSERAARAAGGDPSTTGSGGGNGSRGSRLGIVGTVLAWFAVGCPVCNKIALLALGYTGALTYFAPLQPILAVLALVLTGYALLWRLQGLVVCPVPRPGSAESA